MRAICCAIMAFTTWYMSCKVVQSTSRSRNAISGILIILSWILLVVAGILCVVGL